jgi:hypothetical protein
MLPLQLANSERGLPYGVWFVRDGSSVLFNRHFQPVLERDALGMVSAADPDLVVLGVTQTIFFYEDTDSECEKHDRASAALASWLDGTMR